METDLSCTVKKMALWDKKRLTVATAFSPSMCTIHHGLSKHGLYIFFYMEIVTYVKYSRHQKF